MKTFSVASLFALMSISLSATGETIRAIPRGSSNFDNVSHNSLLSERDINCKREDTTVSDVDKVANALSTGSAVVIYTVSTGAIAQSVCTLLNNHGVGNDADCKPISTLIAASTALIYTSVLQSKTGTQIASRRSDDSLATLLTEHLIAAGTQFESISAMPISKRDLGQYNSTGEGHKVMKDSVSIHGIKHENGYMDTIVTTYTDGTGRVWSTPTPNNATSLSKRHDGPGFKINYQAMKFGTFIGTPAASQLSAGIQLAQGFAQDWADRANNEQISDYIGVTSIHGIEQFAIRIIPEIQGFGENFEPVTICGSLTTSHDEL
jgi:hypothetical protein